jgi:hypothetical protein
LVAWSTAFPQQAVLTAVKEGVQGMLGLNS